MTIIAWLFNCRSLIGIDDANIYFIYMRNFANGHGFVFNVGGERVEGFTSLVWTLLGSLFFYISNYPEQLLLVFNLILVTFTLWKIILYIDDYFKSKSISNYSLFLLLLLAVYPGYFEWTVLSLMETGLWSSLLIFLTLNVLKFDSNININKLNIEFSLLIFILVLCRPESILWGMSFILLRVYQFKKIELSLNKIIYNSFMPIFIFAFTLILLTYWRLSYFGFPLPNTYYAKISSDVVLNLLRGSNYLYNFFINYPVAILALMLDCIAILNLFKNKNTSDKLIIVSTFVFLITLLIPIYTGGDHFNLSRFIQPTLPIVWLSLIATMSTFNIIIDNKLVLMILFVFLIFTGENSLIKFKLNGKKYLSHEWQIAINGRETSGELNLFFKKTKKLPSQGVVASGGSAYKYNGFTFDLLALNNVEMAHAIKEKGKSVLKNHEAFNKNIFYKQKPDIVWLGGSFIKKSLLDKFKGIVVNDFEKSIFKNITDEDRFKQQYSDVVISQINQDDCLSIFASNEFLASLDTNVYKIHIYK